MTEVKFIMADGCDDLIPKKAHHDDAAYDLRSRINLILPCRRSTVVPSGIFLELPVGFEAQIRPRSGLAAKFDIMLTNSPGTVDAGYRGEVGIILYNGGEKEFEIKRGDRIAQMVICKLPSVVLTQVQQLTPSARGDGGFGSTGKK